MNVLEKIVCQYFGCESPIVGAKMINFYELLPHGSYPAKAGLEAWGFCKSFSFGDSLLPNDYHGYDDTILWALVDDMVEAENRDHVKKFFCVQSC